MSSNSGSNLYSQGFGTTSSSSFPGNAVVQRGLILMLQDLVEEIMAVEEGALPPTITVLKLEEMGRTA